MIPSRVMRCSLLAAPVLLCVLIGLPTSAQSLPSELEADSLLRKAFEEMKLQQAGAPPFHLLAKVHIEMDGNFREGGYELLWEAPDRYRENFKMEAMSETDFVLTDKIYVFRTNPQVMFPLDAVRTFLASAVPSRMQKDLQALQIAFEEVNGERRTCVHTHKDAFVSAAVERVCFDAHTNKVVAVEVVPSGTADSYKLLLDDFVDVGAKRYPRHLYQRKFGEILEVKIDALDAAKFTESVFTPPPGLEPRDWCANPIFQKAPGQMLYFPAARTSHFPAYYLFIGSDGRAKNVTLLGKAKNGLMKEFDAWVLKTKFPILMCGDKPVEYDTVVSSNTAGPKFISVASTPAN